MRSLFFENWNHDQSLIAIKVQSCYGLHSDRILLLYNESVLTYASSNDYIPLPLLVGSIASIESIMQDEVFG